MKTKKQIMGALTKKRSIKSEKKRKALLIIFLLLVDGFIWNGLINDLDNWEFKIEERRAEERHALVVQATEGVSQVGSEEAQLLPPYKEIAEYVWLHESTNGLNNYSKCEAIGKINGIGYAIPGDGNYRCFDSHEDEMKVLEGWIIDKQARGMSRVELMCLYSGGNYNICK